MTPGFDPRVDAYKVLGVDPKASADEIKKAYRKLAKQYHPDSTGGDKAKETRFKEISSAYDVLSDSKRRAQYDEIRAAVDSGRFHPGAGPGAGFPGGFAAGGDFGGWDLGELFAQMFGDRGAAGGRGASNVRMHVSRNGEQEFEIHDFVSGGGATQTQGRRARRRGPTVPHDATPPPAPEEQTIRGPDGKVFMVKGIDTHDNLRLRLDEAILGTVREIATLAGKANVKVPPGTSSGVKLRMKGRGITAAGRTGDHFVTIQIDVPRADTDEAKQLLVQLMKATEPPRKG
jgi:molecular chaperone DnaJ